jgi:hypothetical protein
VTLPVPSFVAEALNQPPEVLSLPFASVIDTPAKS